MWTLQLRTARLRCFTLRIGKASIGARETFSSVTADDTHDLNMNLRVCRVEIVHVGDLVCHVPQRRAMSPATLHVVHELVFENTE